MLKAWGICFGPAWATSIVDLIEPAQVAARRGFDRLTIGEYHNDALSWMQILASATDGMRLATTILNVHLRHPAVVAEGVAAIRDVWGDRIELGLGFGHRSNATDEFGLPFQTSTRYLQEYAEAIRHLLRGEGYRGQQLGADLPIQRRRATLDSPPIVIAALGPKGVDHAASYADGLVLTWTPTTLATELVRRFDDGERKAGRRNGQVWIILPCFLDGSQNAARDAAGRALAQYLQLPTYANMLVNAGYGDVTARAIDHLRQAQVDLASRCLPLELLTSVAIVGGRKQLDVLLADSSLAGIDRVIIYPLPVSGGWRDAVTATLDQCSPKAC